MVWAPRLEGLRIMCGFEVSQIVDQAMARYGNGRDLVAASEVIDLLLDIRLLVDGLAHEAIARTERECEVVS